MRTLVILAALVILALVVQARPNRGRGNRQPGQGMGGRRPIPGNAGQSGNNRGGRRPGPGGRMPGGGRPGGGRPKPTPPVRKFEIARWKRQIPFNATENLEAKEFAKYNETMELVFFTSSDRRRLRKTEFSPSNSMLDFNVSKMAIKTFTSSGLVCFITDTQDNLSNTIAELESRHNSSESVPLGANFARWTTVFTGDLASLSERINNFCSPKGCRDSVTIYELSTSLIVNIEATPCLEGLLRCDDGSCVSGTACDGVAQCTDGSDELNCSSVSATTTVAATSTVATTASTGVTTSAAATTTDSAITTVSPGSVSATTTVAATTTAAATTTVATTASTGVTTSAAATTTTDSAITTVSPAESEVIKVTSVFGYYTITIQN